MSGRQDHRFRLDPASVRKDDGADCTACDLQICDLRAEADCTAGVCDPLSDSRNHRSEFVCSYVRLTLIEDVRRSAGIDKNAQHLKAPACLVIDLCVEFPVGEGAGTSLPKLDITRGVKDAGLPVFCNIFSPVLHRLSALQKDGLVAVPRQHQGTEESGRPGSDHNRSVNHLFTPGVGEAIRLLIGHGDLLAPKLRDTLFLSPKAPSGIHIDRVDIK